MSILTVPTWSDPSWSESVAFEGSQFTLQCDYNQRCAAWYMSLADANGIDVYNGVKIVTGFLLLSKCVDLRRPAGDLMCISSTADQSPPSLLDLLPGSGRCTLVYITSDWLTILRSKDAAAIAALTAQIAGGGTSSALSKYGQTATG